ncbi:MAG: hypothetical protein QOI63_79 [Thermoplasmata archaeon]|jgi:uncharacterized protein (TIGR00297 family)|nr:hypothetical protein [Thermoplasmata archaeon]
MAPLWLLVTLLALLGLSTLAYALGALDLLGSVASFFLGLLVALLGGLDWLFLMVAFTGLGVLATRLGYATKKQRRLGEGEAGERGVANVMGNGAAAGMAVLANQVPPVPHLAVQLAFATAVAAVTADTLASEIGSLADRVRSILPPFPAMPVGSNGAVSLRGHLSALAGAALIAGLAIPLVHVPLAWAWVPFVGGFLGCQLDSVLGATLERDAGRKGPLTKQDVNFLASALPALLILVVGTLLAVAH